MIWLLRYTHEWTHLKYPNMLKTRNILLSDRMMDLVEPEQMAGNYDGVYAGGNSLTESATAQPYEEERVLTPTPVYYNPDIATIDIYDVGVVAQPTSIIDKLGLDTVLDTATNQINTMLGIGSSDTTNAIIQKNDVGGIVDVMKPTTTPIPLDSLKNNLGLGTSTTATTATTQPTDTASAVATVSTDNKKYYIIAIVIAIVLALLLIK